MRQGVSEISKLDRLAVSGLAGAYNSLAYKVHEIERHFHGQEKWLGVAASPSGETHIADLAGPGIQPFSLTSGDNNWGSWVQVLGSEDTPIKSGYVYFDAHGIEVISANDTSPFFIQIVGGESAGIADKITAKDYTSFPFTSATNQINSGRFDIMTTRVPAGTKVWARCICIGANAKVITAYVGVHEYEG